MTLKLARLTLILLWREWRAREWLLIMLTLILTTTAITSLRFYADRLLQSTTQQSASLLGGDLVITSTTVIPAEWKQYATSLSLKTADVWTYLSVIRNNKALQLVNVQAVSAHFPVIGNPARPLPHTAWVEPRLLPLLSLKVNETFSLGQATFTISNTLANTLETLNAGWLIAPKVIIPMEDVAQTQTVVPGSRVDYRLLIAGNNTKIEQFRLWILPKLGSNQRLLDIHNQRSTLLNVLEQFENYLQLLLILGFLLSGMAIAMSAQQYMRRHYTYIALWRALGATQRQIASIILLQLFIIGSLSGIIGVIIGYFAQTIFIDLFQHVFPITLADPTFYPAIMGFIISNFLLFIFSYPLYTQLPRTSPLYLWQQQPPKTISMMAIFIIGIGLALMIFWLAAISLFSLFVVDALLLSIGFLYASSILLLRILTRLATHTNGIFRRGIKQLTQHPDTTSMQFVCFTLTITVFFIVHWMRMDLMTNWQHQLPANAPNYFAFNMTATDIKAITPVFKRNNVYIDGIYPMISGRLIALNDQAIMTAIPPAGREHNALHRDLNLSWMWRFPSDNRIVQGRTWQASDYGKPLISVEYELAKQLNLSIGDQLTFQIGSHQVKASILNFHSVEWTSFHPNFFIIFVPGFLDSLPATFITSFHLAPRQVGLINELSRQFPNMTIIDLANIIQKLMTLVDKIGLAVQYLFVVIFFASLLIFIALLQASMDERQQSYTLLRTLGASRYYRYGSVIVEFSCLLIIMVIGAWACSSAITFGIQQYLLR